MYELRSCRQNPDARIQNFCPRIPKPETYDKWYAESGPFKQKMPEEEPLEEIEDQTIDWEFSCLSDWEGTFDYESDQVPDMLFGTINFFDDYNDIDAVDDWRMQEKMLSSKTNSGSTLLNIAEAPLTLEGPRLRKDGLTYNMRSDKKDGKAMAE